MPGNVYAEVSPYMVKIIGQTIVNDTHVYVSDIFITLVEFFFPHYKIKLIFHFHNTADIHVHRKSNETVVSNSHTNNHISINIEYTNLYNSKVSSLNFHIHAILCKQAV